MPKYKLSKMKYDEVSVVDNGGNDDAYIVLSKRDEIASKGLLDPEDVHTPEPLKEKRSRKGEFNPEQARDWRGKWVAGGYHKRGPGYMIIKRCESCGSEEELSSAEIEKLTRKQTKQGDTLSTGPRGENGGSWNENKHPRSPLGQFSTSRGLRRDSTPVDAEGQRLQEDDVPLKSPSGSALIAFENGVAYYKDGYQLAAGTGWTKTGAAPVLTGGARNRISVAQIKQRYPSAGRGTGGRNIAKNLRGTWTHV